ncbi:hypothetical protein B0H17DRAFT_1104207, partial [Mycena rosella]
MLVSQRGLCQWWLALVVASSFYAARRLSYRARSPLPARSIVSFDSSSLSPVPLLASNRALEMSRAARRCARKAAHGRIRIRQRWRGNGKLGTGPRACCLLGVRYGICRARSLSYASDPA